ncbi:protein phosphatase 1, regulatory (inhibitor) subunit 14Aa [Pleuronectes platessa]|uniref:protein phosphatase 1, regulatory (inhibitor) subunit 14Aa n=1 Tax=Pleuronectes platessa TaxID=8262 RepID=UPI00232A53AD|nr:protein phosphatase 1, regulatory (inhibitor) subunit 14Aa [Pleuronectes platessa]
MAEDRTTTTPLAGDEVSPSDPESHQDQGCSIPKRHARVTVKYNRKELQRRLDLEKWIDESLDRLYVGQEGDIPEEVNIDELIDLPNLEDRVKKLQEVLQKCSNNTEVRFQAKTQMIICMYSIHTQSGKMKLQHLTPHHTGGLGLG